MPVDILIYNKDEEVVPIAVYIYKGVMELCLLITTAITV